VPEKEALAPTQQSGPAGRWLLLLFTLLCLAGLGVATDLAGIHLWVHTDPSYRSFCALSETVNCDTVAESPYSVLFGVPVSVWGMLGYLLMGCLSLIGLVRRARPSPWPAGSLLVLAIGAGLSSMVLGTISAVAIHSFCIMCVCTYAINAALLVLAVLLALRRGGLGAVLTGEARALRDRPGPRLIAAAPIAALAAALIVFYPPYWKDQVTSGPGGLTTGVFAEGGAWIGATEPRLTIIEYSDYQCPHCRRGHQEMRELVARHQREVRFIHRHFPLDEACNPLVRRPFHPRACEMARMVICAGRQGKAWEANDLLFSLESKEPAIRDALVGKLGLDADRFDACLADPSSLAAVKADIDDGLKLGVRGTPTYAVGDKTYPGHIPDRELSKLLGEGKSASGPGGGG